MNKTLQWTLGICAVIITLAVAASLIVPIFNPNWGWRSGVMGPGMMYGGGMMGFGWPLMGLGMLIWPLLLIGLVVLGVVAAVNLARPRAAAVCPHCGQVVQAGWKACPHCGEKL
jgi:hypothetical protein